MEPKIKHPFKEMAGMVPQAHNEISAKPLVKGSKERKIMTAQTPFEPSRLPITFTVDGQPFTTGDFTDGQERQPASEILRLAGLDPNAYDLAEIQDKDKPVSTRRFPDAYLVDIKKDDRFVSIRHKAEVA